MLRSHRQGKESFYELASPPKNRKTVSTSLEAKHPQISQQFVEYDSNDHQQTARIQSRPFPGLTAVREMQEPSLRVPEPSLQDLTNEISSQRETITKISHVIDYLTEQNQQLTNKYLEAVNNLEKVQAFYQQKLEAAYHTIRELEDRCSKCETAATSFVQSKPVSARITPMKVYSKSNGEAYSVIFNESEGSGLAELTKVIIAERVLNFEKQMTHLEELSQTELAQVTAILEQQKYMEAYIEDEVLNPLEIHTKEQLESPRKVKQTSTIAIELLNQYKAQIIGWQNYANALKKQLLDCIAFIDKFITSKDLRKRNRKSYTNQDLIKYISMEICKTAKKSMAKKQTQAKQLRVLLEDAFAELNKHQERNKFRKNSQ